MAVSLKHTFTSPKSDGTDSTLVQPSNWNAEHTLTAAAGKVLGRASGTAGVIQELPLAFDATLQSMIPPTGTTAERPATPAAGMMRYNTTTAKVELYSNSAWGAVGGGAAVSGTAPLSPQSGDLWYDTTNKCIKVYDGSAWVIASAGNITVDAFSGNGSTTAFTLSGSPSSVNSTDVFISGVYQAKTAYSLSGATITFSAAPPSGTNNIQIEWGSALAIGTPADGTVTPAKLATVGALNQILVAQGAGVSPVWANRVRLSSTASVSSPWAWSSDNFEQYALTALANALTINADAGSPVDGQKVVFRIKDNGTARALTWTTGSSKSFRAIGCSLPITTVISKTLYVGAVYNSTDARWDVLAIAQEA